MRTLAAQQRGHVLKHVLSKEGTAVNALSTQIACLLIAQFGSDGGIPVNRRPLRQASPQSLVQPSEPTYEGAPAFGQSVADPGQVRQAATAAPDAPARAVQNRPGLDRAEAIVEQLMSWDVTKIEGQPVTLLQCIARAAGTGQQAAAVTAYWRLCEALGRFTQADNELVVLSGISPQSEFEQTQIRAAQRSVDARRAEAHVTLLAAQEKLAEVVGLTSDPLPLPADRPFVGRYQTRLRTMYANRPVPRSLQALDRALPHQLKLIEKRAEAVEANAQLLSELSELHLQGQAPMSPLLSTSRELTEQQDAFLAAVVKYNFQIAAYSQSVVGSRVPAESLVATLIRQPVADGPRMFQDGNVQPAAARQPRLDPQADVGVPTRDVQPAFQANPARERAAGPRSTISGGQTDDGPPAPAFRQDPQAPENLPRNSSAGGGSFRTDVPTGPLPPDANRAFDARGGAPTSAAPPTVSPAFGSQASAPPATAPPATAPPTTAPPAGPVPVVSPPGAPVSAVPSRTPLGSGTGTTFDPSPGPVPENPIRGSGGSFQIGDVPPTAPAPN